MENVSDFTLTFRMRFLSFYMTYQDPPHVTHGGTVMYVVFSKICIFHLCRNTHKKLR